MGATSLESWKELFYETRHEGGPGFCGASGKGSGHCGLTDFEDKSEP